MSLSVKSHPFHKIIGSDASSVCLERVLSVLPNVVSGQ